MKSTVKLLSNLAAFHNIIYVDYQFTWKDLIIEGLLKRKIPVLKLLGLKSRIKSVLYETGSVLLFTPPPILPINFLKINYLYDLGLKVNSWIIRRSIKRLLRSLNIDHPVVFNAFNPFMGLYNHGAFAETSTIYYCYDEISEAEWMKTHGLRIEKEYLTKVDYLITTSKSLLQKKTHIFTGKKSFLIQNGVDFKLFNKAHLQGSKNNGVIGYVGSLDNRLDYDLLENLIKAYPEFRFLFIGRINSKKIEKLRKLENTQFTGSVAYEEIPDILASISVGIIPFIKNDFTSNIYPMKINEYLAAGKPVVTTDFADLSEFGDTIKICSNHKSFIDSFSGIYYEELFSPELIQQRIKIASENSWLNKSQRLCEIIDDINN